MKAFMFSRVFLHLTALRSEGAGVTFSVGLLTKLDSLLGALRDKTLQSEQ